MLRPENVAPEGEILVSEARIANLTQAFVRTWQRPPTQSELTRLIDDYIRTEVFVREAMALGLDRDDAIIRQRLRQKIEFISVDGSQDREATDQELKDYYQDNPQQYRRQTKISFRQVFLDPEKAGADLESEVDRLLKRLNGTQVAEELEAIDGGPVLLKPEWRDTDQSESRRALAGSLQKHFFTSPPASGPGHCPQAMESISSKLRKSIPAKLCRSN